MDKENPWGKDKTRKDVDVHLYRSMIGSLLYLTASRPDIMFAVCACARHQVTPKECHLHACCGQVLWIQNQLLDYGYNFMNTKIYIDNNSAICIVKNHTIVATSTTKAEYVAAASCCGQVLWIQNQLLDYGLSMSCEALSKEISLSILCLLYTAKTFDLVWIWLGGDHGNEFLLGFNGIQWVEKGEYNTDFHPMVDFIAASPLRIKITDEETHILATMDGIQRTVSESSLRRNLYFNMGISSSTKT
nr:hypothetical protein [Tanacetum cinerariifolium]